MKKLFTFLFSVFASLLALTANAETVQEQLDRLHSVTDGTLVRLHALRSPQRYLANTGGESLSMIVPDSEDDGRQLWILRPSGEGFTLQSTLTSRYLSITAGDKSPKTTSSSALLYIRPNTVSTSKTGNWVNISSKKDFSGSSTLNMNNNNASDLYIWALDEGGIWTIEEAEEKDPVAPEEGKVYYLRSMMYDRYLGESSSYQMVTTESVGKNIFPYFSFEKVGEGFRIKSVVTGRCIGGVSGLSKGYTTVASGGQVFEPVRVPHSAYFFKQTGNPNYGLHVDGSYNVVSWVNAPASVLHLEPVEVSEEELQEMRQIYADNQIMASLKASHFTGLFANDQATELTDEYKSLSDEQFLATEKVSALPQPIQEWLLKLKNDTWDPFEKHFRIQEYEASSDHDYWANKVNITAFSPMYNPTGITLQNGETALIFVGNIPSRTASLQVEGHTSWQDHSGQKRQTLKKGFNLFVATADNMQLYIKYNSRNNDLISNYRDIPIHIVGGKVNGYFDARNWTNAQWMAMRQAGLFTDPILDVVGEMVQWRVKSSDVVSYLTKPVDVMENWDFLIGLELDLMGLTACPDSLKAIGGEDVYEDLYPKRFNNRMLCFYNGNGGNPYSTYACTYYTSAYCFTDRGLTRENFDLWTGGHEIGHNLQPAINLAACTEVSNNLFSGMVAHRFGKVGRSVSMNKLQERLASGNNLWLDNMDDVFHLNHMYYCLYLYYHAAGHNRLFWPKMFRLLREDPLVNHNGKTVTADQDYLKFALKACEAAGEDLTEYFDLWGFFIPFSGTKTVADYSKTHITVSQNMINNVKLQMARYPKANGAIMFCDDFAEYNAGLRGTMDDVRSDKKKGYVFGDYLTFIPKTPSQPSNFLASYSKSSGVFSLPGTTKADEAAGIKVYDAKGKLIYIGNTRRMTIPSKLRSKVASFKLSLPDGTDIPLYTRADTIAKRAVKMTVYSPSYPKGRVRYTNGEDAAMLSDLRDGANALAEVEDANLDEAAPAMRTAKNVIVRNGASSSLPQAASLELTDGAGLFIPFEFTAASASYSRTGTGAKFNTVVLPYDMPKTAFGAGAIVEDVDRIEQEGGEVKVYFKEVTEDVIAAGRPVVVYNTAAVDEWTPAITQTSNVTVVPTLQSSQADARLVGSYVQSKIGEGKYKLNLDGTAQAQSDASTIIEPFRAYLEFATSPQATSITLVHVDGTVTGISAVEGDPLDSLSPVYDLQGRRVLRPHTSGIYIQNGKKVIVRQ